MLIGNVTES